MTGSRYPSLRLAHRPLVLAGVAATLTLLGGCAGSAGFKSATAAPTRAAPIGDRAVAKAEQAVQRAPQDPAARAMLAQTYLAAGRFQSAATTFDDAMALGDNSGRTALGLALAKIGLGRQREAVALLDDWRSEIPAADLGLALALAGETARGVAILSDAVRGGESTPKLRQNLAYAYALDGRWSEARLMAAQDLPAAELDQRLAVWMLSALPDRARERVAGLIGAPVRSDPGQPAMLALKADVAGEQLAAQTPAPVQPASPVEVAAAVAEPVQPAAPAELPALAAAEPVAAPVPAAPPVLEQNIAAQIARPATAAPAVAKPLARPSVASAFAPVVTRSTRVTAEPAVPANAPTRLAAAGAGTHLVQLGAFSSQQGARRAWGIFVRRTPGLASYRMTVTTASVRGKTVWRVAAAGLNGAGAAGGLCAQVKARGGACFAYAVLPRPAVQPGLPGRDASGPQRARR
ncbi:tetratricopeptide repeat protein [Novosphingobium piscinae]|uniref:Tetratricopeptide repeat protein n=1 Tax=Novosphingobium piscinae TaxID=1507448 RepID=A0A7X1KR43_9SPHN|nr:tetratricopeptide repeat protein [Novosphingobium piscinae]MBC2670394.1 tetratricopeptide repeat protein [Novosphingobium piscinae]